MDNVYCRKELCQGYACACLSEKLRSRDEEIQEQARLLGKSGSREADLLAQIADLQRLLATERDAFGKKETEMVAKIGRLEKALRNIDDREHFSEACACYLGDNGYVCFYKWSEQALTDSPEPTHSQIANKNSESANEPTGTACKHEESWFDRTIAFRKDGRTGMAQICNDCGAEV
jgi:hypothetical protein